jgi:hypothetical protein
LNVKSWKISFFESILTHKLSDVFYLLKAGYFLLIKVQKGSETGFELANHFFLPVDLIKQLHVYLFGHF